MAAPCVQVQALCVAPAYAAAMAPKAFIVGPPRPDATRAAAIAKLGAAIDTVFPDCIGCVDMRRYKVTCHGRACVAADGVTLRGSTLTLSWGVLARGERPPRHGSPLFLQIQATSAPALRSAVAAVALQSDTPGVAIPLGDVLAANAVRLP